MHKLDIWTIIIDIVWLLMAMVGIIMAGRHENMYEYMHCISLILWFVGARFLTLTWKK